MGRNEGLVLRSEAAKMLQVSPRQFSYLARAGVIPAAEKGTHRKGALYRVTDIQAYQARRQHKADLHEVHGIALRADCLSRSTAGKLDTLCRYLGLEGRRLSYDDEELYRMQLKVTDALKENLDEYPTGALLEWAEIINAVDESYLRVVADYTNDSEPWVPFLKLANHIMDRRGEIKNDVNRTFAYACMDTARKHMRHVAYFFARAQLGVRAANELFSDGVDDEIISQLFPVFPN